jgi:hypothetical protein
VCPGMEMLWYLSPAADAHLPGWNRAFSSVLCFWITTRDLV